MTTHTPGPWGWDSRNGNWYLLTFAADAPHHIVAELKTPLDGMGEADRSAIASVPDMIEALQYIVQHETDPILERTARSALLKARGEA